MAYITTDEVKEIRKELKETFPNLKFSVRKDHHSTVNVSIVKGNIDFTDEFGIRSTKLAEAFNIAYGYARIYPSDKSFSAEKKKLFDKIIDIIKTAPATVGGKVWYDDSDPQAEIYDTAFYFKVYVGNWPGGKPYEYTNVS
tara:strand:+ start:56 stop:478 length:423 start_codon:yes stop_codon:yes gene_type:complete